MDWRDWDKRLATSLESPSKEVGPLQKLVKRFGPHNVLDAAEAVVGLVSHHFGVDHGTLKIIGDAIREGLESLPGLAKGEHGEPRTEQAKRDEQAKDQQVKADERAKDERVKDQQAKDEQVKEVEQEKTEQLKEVEQEKTDQLKEVEQNKAERVKSDAELAGKAEKSAAEIDALKKVFAQEQKELEGKLDGLAKNYFDKYPDLSKEQREESEKTFKGIKDEAVGNLRGQQEARMQERVRTQQEQRQEIAEPKKEPEKRDRS